MAVYKAQVSTGQDLLAGTFDTISITLVGIDGESPKHVLDRCGLDFQPGFSMGQGPDWCQWASLYGRQWDQIPIGFQGAEDLAPLIAMERHPLTPTDTSWGSSDGEEGAVPTDLPVQRSPSRVAGNAGSVPGARTLPVLWLPQVREYEVPSERALGPIVLIRLHKEPYCVFPESTWYCKTVRVTSPEGDTYHFPCYRWIHG
ncbi:Epidermis-type lipoxygenase 3 [Chelonia mydas]|uniref:Epidermis-type lipoxygenase 3 n=1 Tax=Chelonia mydas TaxID=8469 RepID=M7BRZ0_CHEMY|nr:Epidermis-type lipoxygenase 3 [Chelonia mydas]